MAWRYKLRAPWVQETFAHVSELARAGASLTEVAADIGWDEDGLSRELRRMGWTTYDLFRSHCLSQTRARLRATIVRLALTGTVPAATTLLARQILGWGRSGKDDPAKSSEGDDLSDLSMDEINAKLRDLASALPEPGAIPPPKPEPPKAKRGRPPKYRFPQPRNMPDPLVAAGKSLAPAPPDPIEPLTGPRPDEPEFVEIPLVLDGDAQST